MIQIIIPQSSAHDLPFFLAVEEWVATNLPANEYFFAWQVDPTVICGRHQDIPAEVDLAEAAGSGVAVWRRKSGGGAVLADRNNVMFSYITPSAGVETSFSRYTAMICSMLAAIGIKAEPTGRNDIAVAGLKVAGNAFLKLPGRCIVHGTMLCDADFELMARLLTPSRAKRMSKGVVSVPSRVTTLRREGLSMPIADFISHAVDFLCPDSSQAIFLDPEALREVEQIRLTYLDGVEKGYGHAWSKPMQPSPSNLRQGYLEGVGSMKATWNSGSEGTIHSLDLEGDFFPIADIGTISARLEGLPASREAVAAALPDIATIVAGLDAQTFANFLFDN